MIPKAPVTGAELEAHCRARLANYKIPKAFVVCAQLPLLPVGRVDKGALRREAASIG